MKNLGIGTTTPAQKLDVVGSARISGALTAKGEPVVLDVAISDSCPEGYTQRGGVLDADYNMIYVCVKYAI